VQSTTYVGTGGSTTDGQEHALQLDGLFLDFYGTVTTGDRAAVEQVCKRLVEDHELALSPQELAVTWGERFFHAMDFCNGDNFETLYEIEARTLREMMTQLQREVDPYPYADWLRQYWQSPPLQPEAVEFLETFPLPICIISNADREDVDAALRVHQLRVVEVVTSEDVRSYKPAPRIFEEALARTGWRRERVMHVGDSLHSDVGGARLARLHSGWVNRKGRIHDVGTHQPDHEFADLHGITRLLKNGHPGTTG
jgi:2-haloacid dehalogenase/putative hydrolase of the HAD superfamily